VADSNEIASFYVQTGEFLCRRQLLCKAVSDLKDALFTLVLVALSRPIYFFTVRKGGFPLRQVPQEIPVTADDSVEMG
jgi:hypothetical protein